MPLTTPSWMPPADLTAAPFTGYTRAHWGAAADRILDAAWAHADEDGAMVDFAGSGSSPDDRLEGFARTFLLAALRIAGDPAGSAPLAERYVTALRHAIAHEIWPALTDHSQSTVEAASVAIALHLTRDTIWAALDDDTRRGVHAWFEQARGAWCADNNHVLLGATLAAFNHAGGYSDGRDAVDNALDRMDDWYRADGWYTDGDGRRFDHYNAYAFHWYPFFIDRIMGAQLDDRRAVHRERLASFIDGYQHLFDARCAPVFLGRSLIYRWAVAAPFWMARMEGVSTVPASRIRRLTGGILKHFVDGGSLDSGVLSLGWQSAPLPSIVQSYSGTGSPYWAAKGFLGLALADTDPAWTEPETPTVIETRDVRRVLGGPRWLVDAQQDDGIVRLHNLGSDGHPTRDDPLYRRLQFTSATRPVSSGVVRDSDLTIEGAVHRAAVRATVGALGGSVTRSLDAGGRHVVSRIASKIVGTSTVYVARVTNAIGLPGRVSGAALIAALDGTDRDGTDRDGPGRAPIAADAHDTGSAHATVRGERMTPSAHDAALISTVRLLGAWPATPSAAPESIDLEASGIVDRIAEGEDLLLCPAVRLGPLPADVIVVWQTDLGTASAPVLDVRDVIVHDDHIALSAGRARLVFRWSLSEPFPADAEAQLIRHL